MHEVLGHTRRTNIWSLSSSSGDSRSASRISPRFPAFRATCCIALPAVTPHRVRVDVHVPWSKWRQTRFCPPRSRSSTGRPRCVRRPVLTWRSPQGCHPLGRADRPAVLECQSPPRSHGDSHRPGGAGQRRTCPPQPALCGDCARGGRGSRPRAGADRVGQYRSIDPDGLATWLPANGYSLAVTRSTLLADGRRDRLTAPPAPERR